MALAKKSVEELINLVEIKLSCIEVCDTQDRKSVSRLEQCRCELYELVGEAPKGDPVLLGDVAAA
jgi:hypothetical protein